MLVPQWPMLWLRLFTVDGGNSPNGHPASDFIAMLNSAEKPVRSRLPELTAISQTVD